MEDKKVSRIRKRFRIWYSRNKVFVAFICTLVVTYVVANWMADDAEKALIGGGLFLQLWGIVITAAGIISVRKTFNQPSIGQLIKWLLCIKRKPIIQPAGSITIRQTVIGVTPVEPQDNDDRLLSIEENIRALFDHINEDRQSIKLITEEVTRVERKMDSEISTEVSQLKHMTKNLHISGSGLALAGLGLVAIGMVCSALPSFI